MNEPTTTTQAYDGQLAHWVTAFAAGRYQEFDGALDSSCSPNDVRRFLINSFGNRYSWLMREAALVAEAFGNFADLVVTYIRTVPRAPYDITAPSDEERFLVWLSKTQTLTPLQHDLITCQRGEFAVGTEARRNRSGHLRFQQMAKLVREHSSRLGVDPSLRIHGNPIRFVGRLLTSTFAPGVKVLPIDVVFYPAGTRVRAAVLDEAMAGALRELTVRGPCTLQEWVGAEIERREALLPLVGELAAQGLAAFE